MLVLVVVLFVVCVMVFKLLEGIYIDIFMSSVQQGGVGGICVCWGGEIIKIELGLQEICFYLLLCLFDVQVCLCFVCSDDDKQQGCFVVCCVGFYDLEVFICGCELIVIGMLYGIVLQKVGDFDYVYLCVEVDVVYLWLCCFVVVNYLLGFYDFFWGLGWGLWGLGYWGDLYWCQLCIIVVLWLVLFLLLLKQ